MDRAWLKRLRKQDANIWSQKETERVRGHATSQRCCPCHILQLKNMHAFLLCFFFFYNRGMNHGCAMCMESLTVWTHVCIRTELWLWQERTMTGIKPWCADTLSGVWARIHMCMLSKNRQQHSSSECLFCETETHQESSWKVSHVIRTTLLTTPQQSTAQEPSVQSI